MPGTPLASLHHSIYPLMMRVLVDLNWLLEYVESGRGTCVTMLATVATAALFWLLWISSKPKSRQL